MLSDFRRQPLDFRGSLTIGHVTVIHGLAEGAATFDLGGTRRWLIVLYQ